MKALKLKIKGEFAHFSKPEVNEIALATYMQIHKPALLGLFGAICGYKGLTNFRQQFMESSNVLMVSGTSGGSSSNARISKRKEEITHIAVAKEKREIFQYPEYYEKLKKLKVAIEPSGIFNIQKESLINCSGLISNEKGGSLLFSKEILICPEWTIYIMQEDSESYRNLKNRLLNKDFVYQPYLGKKTFSANISEVEEIEISPVFEIKEINSLFYINENVKMIDNYVDFDETYSLFDFSDLENENSIFSYMELLPYKYSLELKEYFEDRLSYLFNYQYRKFFFTNKKFKKEIENIINKEKVFNFKEKTLFFF